MNKIERIERLGKIIDLCKASLDLKWYHSNHYTLNDVCPFCTDTMIDRERIIRCNVCLCPPIICKDRLTSGYIKDLANKYGKNAMICLLDTNEIKTMQNLFKNEIARCKEEIKKLRGENNG